MSELRVGGPRPVDARLTPPWRIASRDRGGASGRAGERGADRPSARQRLLQAVIDQSSVVGFHDVLVNDLCEICGISRRTFYNYFPDVPELFLVAYGQVEAELRHHLRTSWVASGGDSGAVIDALVEFACADPVRADAFFVQALAAGRPVADRRQRTLEWCGGLLAPREDGVRPLAREIASRGVWDVIRTRVSIGDFDGLRRDAASLVSVTIARPGAVAAQLVGSGPPTDFTKTLPYH